MSNSIKRNFSIKEVVFCYKNYLPKGKIRTLSTPERFCHCFAYILGGETEYTTDDNRKFTVKKGDVLYLSKGQKYVIDVKDDDYHFIVIDFNLDVDKKLKSDCIKCESPALLSEFIKAEKIFNSQSNVKNAKMLAVANQIYAILCEEKTYSSSKDKSLVLTATDYIANNLENPELSILDVANHCKISQVHLRRLFKKVINLSPIEYVNNLRFNKAESLLSSNETKIQRIAEVCGFNDLSYFSKAYKKRFGLSPSKKIR